MAVDLFADLFDDYGLQDFTQYTPDPSNYVDLGTVSNFLADYDFSVPEIPGYDAYDFSVPEIPGFEAPTYDFSVPELSARPQTPYYLAAPGSPSAQAPGGDVAQARLDAPPALGAPTAVGKAGSGAGEQSAATRAFGALKKNPVGAAMGLGGLALVGKGLLTKTPSVATPSRAAVQLSPAEQAAAGALTASRTAAQGTPAARGYAGEEGIRRTVNDQIMAALLGDDALVSPDLVKRRDDDLRTLEGRLRTELGPGWASSTAGENAIANRKRQWEAIFEDARQQRLGQLNTMGLSRTDFARQLELDPAQLASTELSLLAGIGSQDAALRYSAEATNAANRSAESRAALGAGGQLVGAAAGPYMLQAYLDALKRTS